MENRIQNLYYRHKEKHCLSSMEYRIPPITAKFCFGKISYGCSNGIASAVIASSNKWIFRLNGADALKRSRTNDTAVVYCKYCESGSVFQHTVSVN